MDKAVAYARYSTDMQREESIEAQLQYIYEYAEKKGISIIKNYIDRAVSGKSAEGRTAFLDLIKDSAHGEFNTVLVHKSNRFARNREESAIYKHKLRKNGVKVIAVAQDYGEGPHTVIIEALMEGLDEYYSLELANETMKGLIANANKCKHNGGRVLYGYKVNSERNYEIEEHEAEVVKNIFESFVKGESYAQILDMLSAKGITNRNRAPFSKSTIYEMLRNERYKGVYVFNKTPRRNDKGKRNNRVKKTDEEIIRIDGGMPAIVSPGVWQKAQDILDKRKYERPVTRRNNNYILTGFIECAKCGGAYVGYATKSNYYVCSRKKNRRDCDNINVSQAKVESFVITKIQEWLRNVSIDKLVEDLNERYAVCNVEIQEEKAHIKNEIAAINKKISNLLDVLSEIGAGANSVKERLSELSIAKDRLEYRLSNIKSTMPVLDKNAVKNVIINLDPAEKGRDKLRDTLRLLRMKVVVHPTGHYELTHTPKEMGMGEYNAGVGDGTPEIYSLITEVITETKTKNLPV